MQYLINFFLGGNKRSVMYKKNVCFLIITQALNIITSLLLVPIVLNYLGVDEYGVWITLTTIVTWLSFFDIGIGHGLRNKYAESKALNNDLDVKLYVSTAFFVLSGISLSIFILFSLGGFFINWATILAAPSAMKDQLGVLMFYVIATFCIRFVVNIVCILLTADQHPAVAAILNLCGNVLSLITVSIIIKVATPNLLDFGICLTTSQIFPIIVAFIFFFSTRYKAIYPRWKYFSKSHVRAIFSLGIRFFMIQITALLLFQTNNIIIAHACGLPEVAEYNISYKYINIVNIFFMTLLGPFWSASTEAYTKGDILWLNKSVRILNIIWIIIIMGGVVLILISPFLYKFWIGDTIIPNYLILSLLLFYFAAMMRSNTYRSFMNGVGKIQLQFYITMIQSIIHIPLAYFLGKELGIVGILIPMILWQVVNSIWEPIQYNMIITNKAKGIWNK